MSGLGLPFKVFLLVGLLAAVRQRGRERPVAFLNAFLGVALGFSFAPIVTQRDNWPFSAWPLVALYAPETMTQVRVVALDALGREHEIDFRAWRPLDFGELFSWLQGPFQRLAPAERDAAFAYLLYRVEAARQRALEHGLSGQGWLGPLETPSFVLHPRRWKGPDTTPREPFVGLRLYRETWSPEMRARDGSVARKLALEYLPKREER